MSEPSATAETVFRREWGRAVALVARLTGNLGLAEDAVHGWPRTPSRRRSPWRSTAGRTARCRGIRPDG